MARAASGGHILGIHGGIGIGARQDEMRGVATGASRRHGQAAFHQALAVNAFGVILNDFVLRSGVAQGCFHALAVATAAEFGHVGREGLGLGIVFAQDVVRAVAVLADGRIVVAGRLELCHDGCADIAGH